MSLSPEILKTPEAIGGFPTGLIKDLLWAIAVTRAPRSFYNDAAFYLQNKQFTATGFDNLPKKSDGGALIVFNHPQVPLLINGMMILADGIHNHTGRKDLALVIGSEVPLSGEFGDKYIPGTPWLMKRLLGLYGDNVIATPTKKTRRDYRSGRLEARNQILNDLNKGYLVALSPEARVEVDGRVVDNEKLRFGSGGLAKQASRWRIPQIPVGIFYDSDELVRVIVGNKFFVDPDGNDKETAAELMKHVEELLPHRMKRN